MTVVMRRFVNLVCLAGLLLGPLGLGRALHESALSHGPAAAPTACSTHHGGDSESHPPGSDSSGHHDGCAVCLSISTASTGIQLPPPIQIERGGERCGNARLAAQSCTPATVDLAAAAPRAPPCC